MTKRTSEKINPWGKVATEYAQFLVPNVPSEDTTKNYGILIAQVLKNKKRPKVMIMGATPELRRILYTYKALQGAEVFCCDTNHAMYQAMTNFLARGKHAREKYVRASWLNTGFPDQYFDLITGDEVICNVEAKLHNKLFGEISRILKKDGAWVTRHNVYLAEDQKTSVARILTALAAKIYAGEYDFQLAMNVLYLEIFYHLSAIQEKSGTIKDHLKIMRQVYCKSLQKNRYSRIIIELINLYEDNFVPIAGDYPWYFLSAKASEEEIKKVFVVKKKVYACDHPSAQNGPIYILLKKYGSKR